MYSNERPDFGEISKKVPQPAGYRILVAIPKLNNKTDGGVLLPDQLKDLEETATIIGYVLSMGTGAYKDAQRFPDGPWCKVGDFVIFRSYSGTRFKIEDQEFRIINDDTVEAVVDDPRGYKRA